MYNVQLRPFNSPLITRSIVLCSLTFACTVYSGQQQDDESILRKQEELQRKKQEGYRKLYDSMPKLEIKGRVVDQYGDPVPGATVTVEWKSADEYIGRYSGLRTDTVKTDANGDFKLPGKKMSRASASAEKDGYASLSGESYDLVQVRNQTLEAIPAVITLRKRGERTFLLCAGNAKPVWVWMYTNTASRASMDVLLWAGDGKKPLTRYEDLRADITYDHVERAWLVKYSVGQSDGLLCAERCLYEAPESGHTNSVALTVKEDCNSQKEYIYLRTRSPSIYSRIQFNHRASHFPDEGPLLRIYPVELWVNPYGERNLEYDERFERSWRARDELTQEALTAFGQGHYPEKCGDVPARIKAADKRKKVPNN